MINYLYIILRVQRTKVMDKRRINRGMKKKEKTRLWLFMTNFTTKSRNGTPYDERNEPRPGWFRFDGVKSDFIATRVWLNAVNRYHRHFFLISGLHVRCRGLHRGESSCPKRLKRKWLKVNLPWKVSEVLPKLTGVPVLISGYFFHRIRSPTRTMKTMAELWNFYC